MKNRIKFPAIVLGLLLLLTGFTQQTKAQDDDVSLQTFYDELSPYGTWIQDQEYGYVWRPDVDQRDFRPYYSNGRWAMTEYGNTWVSDYDWGWAPFHYGRWVTNRYNQWLWIPDTTWGPAWVSWRSGGGYYGWAPLGPRMGVSVNFGFSIPDLWWCFVPQANIYYSSFPRYYANRNYGILSRTTYITNVYVHNRNSYYTGPRRDDIRRATRQDVRVYNINRSDRPGRGGISNNNINIYTPRGGRGDNANAVPRTVAPGSSYIANRGGRGENGNATRPDRGTANPGDRGTEGGRPGRFGTPGNRNQSGADRQQRDAQTPEQRQQRQQQFEQQRQQRGDAQRQQGDQQRQQRNEAENQQREQQRQQRGEAQRQQADQQRQEADQQQRQQRSEAENQQRQQQREQQAQQRQQAEQQQRQQRSEAENQQRQQQREQAQQQRQQADQQRQQQAQQQRQQVDQQRQQQQQQRSSESRGGGEGRGGRSGRN